jgi:hypothetical protein
VEINSHSLFSKWFSESGKLVQRLFNMVHDLVNDEQNFVVVMIGQSGLSGSDVMQRRNGERRRQFQSNTSGPYCNGRLC